jgi:hypothetical protein
MDKTEVPIDKELEAQLLEFTSWSVFSKKNMDFVKETILSLGSTMSFIFVLLWLLVAKLFSSFTSIEFGWSSEYREFILVGIVISSFLYSFFEIIRTSKPSPKLVEAIKKDLAKNVIDQISYEVKDVKVFEEPEHGGFVYYLLTTENQVIVVFDSESQDLSINGEDPRNSSYLPRKYFEMYKTKL